MVISERNCLHRLFEAQAEAQPGKKALVFKNEFLTYHELNRRANQLAHYLVARGVGRETLVGIYLERSPEMVIAILAVLKAGGAYVPLDPVNPVERIAFMVEDSRASVLLARKRLAADLPSHSATVVLPDADAESIAQHCPDNCRATAGAADLAYVMYTSGSTGKPKGVMVQHDNVVGLFHSTEPWFGFNRDDVWTLFHSYAFDFSVWELWGALLYGGTLIIVPYMTSRSPEEFYEMVDRQGVTILNQTPSAFRQLMQVDVSMGPRVLKSLRKVIFGGEALDFKSLRQWFERYGENNPELINMYGITETTVHVTYRRVLAQDSRNGSGSMIGVPIPDLEVYLLDTAMRQQPAGTPGEVYVGGRGVARGYLNREQLTRERFLQNPFSKDPRERLYRSGDLAKRLPNGDLEYLGRIDHQVQLRGFRVELPEIESNLCQHPAVRQSAVIVREDIPEDKRLVAYMLSERDTTPTVIELRSFLKTKLAEYMVPTAFVWLDAFPLTTNGKLDVRALPAPDARRPDLGVAYVQPRTGMEKRVERIWSAVLGVEAIGVFDDFFALGGDSLLATQAVVRIQEELKKQLPMISFFKYPTIAALAVDIAGRSQTSTDTIIASFPVDRREKCPLSFAQQRLLFLFQLMPANTAYSISQAFRLHGALDARILQKALDMLLVRHETLRTVFQVDGGEAMQVITDQEAAYLEIVDFQKKTSSTKNAAVASFIVEAARRNFDLEAGPLVRFFLLDLAENESIVLITMHHIISDGWSFGVLYRELGEIYSALVREATPVLKPLAVQYAEYVYWQQKRVAGSLLEEQTAYWQKKLSGAPAVLALPLDHQRPAVQSFKGRLYSFTISEKLTAELTALSRREGVTLFMVLLACFKVLLYRYSGQCDIVVGTPIANRNHVDLEGLIGFFVNTLVFRTDLAGNPTFSELLARVRAVALGAYAHQDMPFEKLVQTLQSDRDLSYSPVFQVMFAYHNVPHAVLDLPQIRPEALVVDSGASKFDITLNMWEDEGRLGGTVEYCTDLFEDRSVERMFANFQTLLESVVREPTAGIETVPILTEDEQRQLLRDWNETDVPYADQNGFHRRIEVQQEKTPDAVAAVFDGQCLTYRQLNERSNQLAHWLINAGVRTEMFVAVSMERSLDMLIGLLGIVKAGGTYVPLDPAYPRERLEFMLQDANVAFLVTQSGVKDRLPHQALRSICLDTDWEEISRFDTADPKVTVTPKNLAYVIYTSGSTGKPKGVQVPHGAVINFLISMGREPGLHARDVLLAVTTLSFDIHVLELYLPLTVGARIVIAGQADTVDGRRLAALMVRAEVSVMQATPGTWRLLLEAGWRGSEALKVLCGGEAFPRDLAQELFVRAGSVWNMYGPTETTVWSSCYRITDPSKPVSIGRPIANTQIYILDKYMQLVPVGVPGELYIGGDGVTRGYLNRPALTERQFVPDPFSVKPNARLYRTGDLTRYRSDGLLEYLNRMDTQVKVRGFRIELGEIETVLQHYEPVEQAVVIVREDNPGDVRIAAYYVSSGGVALAAGQLKEYLRTSLPEYMLPQHFIRLAVLPLTPSGKIDRKGLPAPNSADKDHEKHCMAPRTDMEKSIAAIWQEALGLDRIGVHDNFFDLGGHSLLAAKVLSEMETRLNFSFSLQALFMVPTVAGMANIVASPSPAVGSSGSDAAGADACRILFPIQRGGDRPPIYFCAGAHDNDDDFLRYLSNLIPSLGLDQPVYAFRPEDLMYANKNIGVKKLAARYIQEMLNSQPAGPYYIGAECVGGIVAYEMVQQLQAMNKEVALLVMLDTECPTPEMLKKFKRDYHIERLGSIGSRLWKSVSLNPAVTICRVLNLLRSTFKRSVPISGEDKMNKRWKHLGYAYRGILLQYRPKPYAGQVVLIINREDHSETTALGWDRVGISKLITYRVPGNHVTRMTTHRHILGGRIKACIDEALSKTGDSAGSGHEGGV